MSTEHASRETSLVASVARGACREGFSLRSRLLVKGDVKAISRAPCCQLSSIKNKSVEEKRPDICIGKSTALRSEIRKLWN